MNNSDNIRLIDQLAINENEPFELLVLSVKKTGIRCLHLPTRLPVTFRKVRWEMEGEIITVMPTKIWQFKNTVYIAGSVTEKRIDIDALNIVPLKLENKGLFNPDKEDLIDKDSPLNKFYLPTMAYGERYKYEMEQVIPFENPEDWDSDPILEAVEAKEKGDNGTAYQILKDMLAEDIRCIDAHAHLGNWAFDRVYKENMYDIKRAKRHYELGAKIAEYSIGAGFHDLLPWGYINNRPYLRCLHGYGLSLWRLGENEAAKEVFEKMLWLNPLDNQGARFLLANVETGKTWQKYEVEEQV